MATMADHIEVDPSVLENIDDDSYLSSGYDTSTASLTSSIHEYIFENGRRYHAYFGTDKVLQPNDETEQDRLDFHHEVFLILMDGKLHLAPVDEPHRILDIAAGTGIWAIDAAEKYPMAEVIGTDLSPIQPQWVPPNCRFEIDDAEQAFTYKPDSIDYVHVRNIAQGITDWPFFTSEIFRVTKPGGYVELSELELKMFSDDGTMTKDNGIKVYMRHLRRALKQINRPSPTAEMLRKYLEDAGFVDIHVKTYKQPFGPWAKDARLKRVGAMNLLNVQTAFHSYGMAAFTRILGLDPAEADKLCRDGIASSENKNHHTYNHFHVLWARKPKAEE